MSLISDFLIYFYKKIQTDNVVVYNFDNFPGENYLDIFTKVFGREIRCEYDFTPGNDPLVRIYIK
jgi:hypothetical protein